MAVMQVPQLPARQPKSIRTPFASAVSRMVDLPSQVTFFSDREDEISCGPAAPVGLAGARGACSARSRMGGGGVSVTRCCAKRPVVETPDLDTPAEKTMDERLHHRRRAAEIE